MRYLIAARKGAQADSLGAASAAEALAAIYGLADRGFEIVSLVDENGRDKTIEELHKVVCQAFGADRGGLWHWLDAEWEHQMAELDDAAPRAWPWIAVVVLASLGLSRAFACATPFAALATLGAFTLRRREAVALVLGAWFGNQAIGFGLLHYPWDEPTLAWGAAIGLAASAALAGAAAVARRPPSLGPLAWTLGLAAAFVSYELVLWAASLALPSAPGAFGAVVVSRILLVNAVALGILVAVCAVASHAGLAPRRTAVLSS